MLEWNYQGVIQYPWKLVTLAIWNKYPNKYAPNVVSTDVLERKLDENGVLHTLRLISFTDSVPWPLRKILNFGSTDTMNGLEYSTVDPKSKIHKSHTINLSYDSITRNLESLEYVCNSEDQTNVNCRVVVETFFNFFYDIEKYQIEKYHLNREKGTRALMYALNKEYINSSSDKFKRDVSKIFSCSQNYENFGAFSYANDSARLKNPFRFVDMHITPNSDFWFENYLRPFSFLLDFSWIDFIESIKQEFGSLALIFKLCIYELGVKYGVEQAL